MARSTAIRRYVLHCVCLGYRIILTSGGCLLFCCPPALGRALFTIDGQEWKERRAILNSSFQMKSVNALFPIITDRSAKMSEYISEAIAAGKPMEMSHVFTSLTLVRHLSAAHE